MTPRRTINRISCAESFSSQTGCFPARSTHQAKAQRSLRTGVGGLVAVSVDGDFYFPGYDNNGNVIGYWNEEGDLVAEYAYDAFGNTIYEDGDMADFFPHRFSTKYYDAETDLYYYGYRYYSPSLGRWISRDPIGERGGLNLYLNCRNATPYSYDGLGLAPVFTITPSEYLNLSWDWKAIDSDEEGGHTQPHWTIRCCLVKVDLNQCPGLARGECWGVEYKVAIVLQVFLNSNSNSYSHTPDLAYGHEQRHVQAYLQEVELRLKPFLKKIDNYGFPNKATVEKRVKEYEKDIAEIIDEMNKKGRNHILPHPLKGKGIPPIGGWPASPTKQPVPPTEFSCCEP